ncbi:hypothetical protein FUAX_53250 (plasmid) [Fulvitalea axinellae]|uniref:Uncharacterized protein n=1 Tax=Fulvitalea axinellae TaxID=1182444 RepID=A0AAU9DAF9_9BACT|nr:hypothetical protein FUAX_53250 [Fulvitalea axinellae]
MVRIMFFVFMLFCIRPAYSQRQYYDICHMVNNRKALDFAVKFGANSVEMDLQFKGGSLTDYYFYHGSPCDCTGRVKALLSKDNICKLSGMCNARVNAKKQLNEIASQYSSQIALVYIDSKVEYISDKRMLRQLGDSVFNLLENNLLDVGYRGVVLIAAPKVKHLEYLKEAYMQAKTSKYRDQYYFTIDGEGKNYDKTMSALRSIGSSNIIYSTGISALAPGSYHTQIKQANKDGVFSIVWTLEKSKSMKAYLKDGAGGIMTNTPRDLKRIMGKENKPLATYSYRP